MKRFKESHPEWLENLEYAIYWLALSGAYCHCGPFPVLKVWTRETRKAEIHALMADAGVVVPEPILRENKMNEIQTFVTRAIKGAQILQDRNLRLFVLSEHKMFLEPVIAKAVKALAIIGGDNSVPLPASVNIGRHGGIDDQRSLAQFLKELKSEGGLMTHKVRRTKVEGIICPRCGGKRFTWFYSIENPGWACLSCNKTTILLEGWVLGVEVNHGEATCVDVYGFLSQTKALSFADGVQAMADILDAETEVRVVSEKIMLPSKEVKQGFRVEITKK